MKRNLLSNAAHSLYNTRKLRANQAFIVLASGATHSNAVTSYTCPIQKRNKTVEVQRNIDFSWEKNRKAALNHTYLTLEQSKEAVKDMKTEFDNHKTDIETISKMCK